MTDFLLEKTGPVPPRLTDQRTTPIMKRVPWPFLVVVVIPTVLAAIYFLLIASPRYVSEARFVVRSAGSAGGVSSFGIALEGVGLSGGQTDAYAVHEYINSLTSVDDLQKQFDMAKILGPRGADMFARYPRLGESQTREGMKAAMQRFVTVGYDSTTGISTLRVEVFRPLDAQRLNAALLDGGERLVNRLNERSSRDAVSTAIFNEAAAKAQLAEAQQKLADFRNQQAFIDPTREAVEHSQLIGGLLASVAQLQAERSQIATEAPQSPQLPAIDSRIAAYQRQIATERAKIAGSPGSLAPSIGAYEALNLDRTLAGEQLAQATAALLVAQQEARRQQLYLERVVPPSLPDESLEPKRLLSILAVLASCLLAYGVGWLLWAGVREHRQA